jgi:hypothetical protein
VVYVGCRGAEQRPGETVFVPAGWWHVVLNCQGSTALSSSLALRRDFNTSHAALLEEDAEFALAWLASVSWLPAEGPFGFRGVVQKELKA